MHMSKSSSTARRQVKFGEFEYFEGLETSKTN